VPFGEPFGCISRCGYGAANEGTSGEGGGEAPDSLLRPPEVPSDNRSRRRSPRWEVASLGLHDGRLMNVGRREASSRMERYALLASFRLGTIQHRRSFRRAAVPLCR
jgi:hypothetical protein